MHLREWVRRGAVHGAEGSAADLVVEPLDSGVAEDPPPTRAGARSGSRVCSGTACQFGEGAAELDRRLENLEGGPLGRVRCLGHCYAAPAFESGRRIYARPASLTATSWIESWGEGPQPAEDLAAAPRRALVPAPVVLRNLVPGASRPHAPWELEGRRYEYALPAGEVVIEALAGAERGRREAARWRAARDAAAPLRVVVVNGDEGDPGAYVDRLLLEEDPHSVLAGAMACARAIGANRVVVAIRAEYTRAREVTRLAIQAARAAGCLAGVEFAVVAGAGCYVCGEDNALLAAIEGRRGEPWIELPDPATAGLFGAPTVVEDVTTLATVPWIARNRRAPGTLALCISGAVARPGVVEVALGTPLVRAIEAGAGGPAPGARWKMALVGGPLGRLLPVARFDQPLDGVDLPGPGHAGIVVLDDRVSAGALARHLFEFARDESCGACDACRDGVTRLAEQRDPAALERLLGEIESGSRCGFGRELRRPIRDLLEHFGAEVFA